MATYAAPTGATIRAYTRLQGAAYGLTDVELEAALLARVGDGEDDVFSRIGVGYETGSYTARQIRHLTRAISFRTASVFLWELYLDRVGGTIEPLLIADPDEILRTREACDLRATEQEALLRGAGEVVNTKPFAKPSIDSGTFTILSTDRAPSERGQLQDERDDVSAWDEDNG